MLGSGFLSNLVIFLPLRIPLKPRCSAQWFDQQWTKLQAQPEVKAAHGGPASSMDCAPQPNRGYALILSTGLVELHIGEISARSAGFGLGSRVEVCIPYRLATSAEDATDKNTQTRANPARTITVLIADDNRDSAETLAALLRTEKRPAQFLAQGVLGGTVAAHVSARNWPPMARTGVSSVPISCRLCRHTR